MAKWLGAPLGGGTTAATRAKDLDRQDACKILDDALNDACREWADARSAPTLLVETDPTRGLTDREAQQLSAWAHALSERS